MTARMTIGTAMLFVFVVASGRLSPVTQLGGTQWMFVVITGCILLVFTATTFTAIRHASVSSVLAIGTAAPIITTLIQVVATGRLQLSPVDIAGLVVMVVAVPAIIVVGVRQDNRAAAQGNLVAV
jgi:drug/metabolite transporter (DMT)-like permease